MLFNTLPNGSKGYNWLISGIQYAVKFGKAIIPNSRPNVLVEIRSETLWRFGVRDAIKRITLALEEVHAEIIVVKPSRIDLCMDMLIPDNEWDGELFANTVCRARKINYFTESKKLEGVQIGKGDLSCRLYDKALEIETISQKTWMYDVWGIPEVPETKRAIRVEFQLRRQSLKDLGIDTMDDCIGALDNIWAYCTQKWLKFQTNPGKHHTQRKTLDWWQIIQNRFLGVSEPVPAIRAKAVRTTQFQLASQVVGLIVALASVDDEFGNEPLYEEVSQEGLVKVFRKALRIAGKSSLELRDAVNWKRAKNYRGKAKYQEANYNRLAEGLPADMLSLGIEDDATWILYDMGAIK
ncbi:hypothetical protein LF599_02495 [Pseudodesulfovibrio thermohalotolerans]|uniref:hypothetical protein n=1 Tax=Pseudodesulfovibrio thermohalotolerans TaxID=2880651 RepID=UPI0024433798|nr:hypothetical protein [Pseudodesulfovibrio thermohalotolerans]WFS63046.1 hypothetical protein LF599_02495 [Pseudodesulfovibrio thermohalotolerans]